MASHDSSASHDSPNREPHGELEGQVALVTGAARGFGRSVALLLAREGASVVVSDIGRDVSSSAFYAMSRTDELEQTGHEIRQLGGNAITVQADVTSSVDCAAMVSKTLGEFGKLDILIANAGVWSLARPWEFTEEEWDVTIDVNLKGAWLSAKYAIPPMIERQHGKIVFVSSIAGLRAYPWYAPYIAAKHGVVGLMKSLAVELGEHRINVNAVCPCQMGKPVASDIPDPVWERAVGHAAPTADEFEAAVAQEHALAYLGIPDYADVAEGVLWLVSERARLVTGHALPVDAGWVAKRGG